ncbi:non-canonical purine NTP pyrophosphatase [Patescibacteria group bacterium]|nr:non-canonical purine NTP pyrophosphatase [Patescibacteria group bacterium]
MKQLLIATTNPGKLAEIKEFLSDMPIELMSLDDKNIIDRPEETGKTFEENAVLKAKFYADKSGLPTIADDGGFEIDALGGEPGVKSHRWIHGDREDEDEELIAYTMERLKGVPLQNRGAKLRVVIAFSTPGGKMHTAEASVCGIIPLTPSAARIAGYPYRSLLYLPRFNKFYNHDDLTPEENESINHRKKALEELKPFIRAALAKESPRDFC